MLDFIITYWIEFFFAAVISIFSFAFRNFKAEMQKNQRDMHYLREGVKALLKSQLLHHYDMYMGKGYISILALESVTSMYESYSHLGGNGTVTKLYAELKELPSTCQKL